MITIILDLKKGQCPTPEWIGEAVDEPTMAVGSQNTYAQLIGRQEPSSVIVVPRFSFGQLLETGT